LPAFEIIVVDNNSTDDSCAMLGKDFPEVTLVHNISNEGFSRANNKAVSIAKGAYLLILNPDMIVGENALRQVYELAEKTDRLGAVGVQFIDGSGGFLPECKRNFPTPKVAVLKFLGFSKRYYADQIRREATAEVDVLTGAFMFMKKKVYEEVGGFDEDFFMYGEDIDLSYRITQAGYKNFYFGAVQVIHFKGESTVKDSAYFQHFYGAMQIFFKKHYQSNVIWNGLIKGIVHGMILIRSNETKKAKKQQDKYFEWTYLGKNEQIYDKLKARFPKATGSMTFMISDEPIATDRLFLDSSDLTFSQIISRMDLQKSTGSTNRIISEGGVFYLGSDNSDDRGEVVLL
jgi:GT2 family glycosyltransferase